MSNDVQYKLTLPVSAEKVYKAVATEEGVRDWWTKFADVGTKVGDLAEFRFPHAGFYAEAKIQSLIPNKLVEWNVIDSMHPEQTGFLNLRDWVGTTIKFEIESKAEEESVLHFTHIGLSEKLECFEACERGWSSYLSSLEQLLVRGVGKPYTDDSTNNIKKLQNKK
ncbi:SRPBCC domain-containing protein [Fictibacillus nanhaiensis]|uniref:SRPBCC family protein n=1 Tax=Fictibacillus nanhaiensis TaxID=742169 RepID=UPI001C9841B9|nr:SRPBCC domain-containing protein [Fictibacillus nanhaiensis]MBY6036611.1 SRPBCC domain-containing protein [Fictibacillus nanhaiensis]